MAKQARQRDLRDYCTDEEFTDILKDLRLHPREVINCTHLEPKTSDDDESVDETVATDAAVVLGSAAAAGVGVPRAATAGLTAVGFTNRGIAAGSLAAARHSCIGNVGRGSLFAAAQRTGATGGFSAFGPLGIGAALLVGGSVLAARLADKEKKRKEKEMRKEERKRNREAERLKRIEDGTARSGVDICEKCWVKMRLRQCNQNRR